MYDCWTLLQEIDDYKTVRDVYRKISEVEIGYRSLDINSYDCLKDTINCCMCLIGRGRINPVEYEYLSSGIDAIAGHVYNGKINGEYAVAYGSELLGFATHLFADKTEYHRIDNPGEYSNIQLNIHGSRVIKGLRKTNPIAYAHILRSINLLQERGLYTESILK